MKKGAEAPFMSGEWLLDQHEVAGFCVQLSRAAEGGGHRHDARFGTVDQVAVVGSGAAVGADDANLCNGSGKCGGSNQGQDEGGCSFHDFYLYGVVDDMVIVYLQICNVNRLLNFIFKAYSGKYSTLYQPTIQYLTPFVTGRTSCGYRMSDGNSTVVPPTGLYTSG
jgi:hypothetical protein